MPFDDDIFGSNFGSGKCSASGTAWVRPSRWLPMPETPANTVNMLVRIEDSLDPTYASVIADSIGNFFVDWGDGAGAQSYASGTNAVKAYSYAAAPSNAADATLGYKQALIRVSSASITSFRLNVIPSVISSWAMHIQPYLDISLNLPSCMELQSSATNCQCREIERWVILAIGDIVGMSSMFQNNYSCQSYSFPAGFGALATNMSSMFASNFACLEYTFPAGFGNIATNMLSMFTNNYSCSRFSFPDGFGAVATNMGSMFAYNYSCLSYVFPAGFGSVATIFNYMFYSNYSCQSYSFPAGFGIVATSFTNMLQNNYACRSYVFPAGFGSAATVAVDVGPISQRSTTRVRGLAYAQSFSLASSNLQVTELIAVFNALPTVTGKSLTITGNPGVSALTAANDLIATGKGWTLVK